MSKLLSPRGRLLMVRGGKLLALLAATALSACVVQPAYVPPPRVYAPPPPPPPPVAVEADAGGGAVEVTATEAPPPLPDYEQPPCPEDGYLWTPGYWHYGAVGYYWVPGTWVQPPSVGVLWTPGYWGFAGGVYGFHAGYWGPHIGFYGGLNYGFGYGGVGFVGGRWDGGHYRYNTAITNVDVKNVHNTYVDHTVVKAVTGPNHAFNGRGGITAQPSRGEAEAARAPHQGPTQAQASHAQEAHNSHLAAHGAPRR